MGKAIRGIALPGLLALLAGTAAPLGGGEVAFPLVYLCDAAKEGALVRFEADGTVAWRYPAGGPVVDVEPVAGGFLLGGGFAGAMFLEKRGEAWNFHWDWEGLKGLEVAGAVTGAREWGAGPSLVLVADAAGRRLVLAEARSRRPKIRWEFPLPAQPRSVRLCPDSGFFLAACAGDPVGEEEGAGLERPVAVVEVDYTRDAVVRSFGIEEGLRHPLDAARDGKGRTFVADGESGAVAALGAQGTLWRRNLEAGEVRSVAVLAGTPARLLALTVAEGEAALFLLDAEEGKVLARRAVPPEAGGAGLRRAVPAEIR